MEMKFKPRVYLAPLVSSSLSRPSAAQLYGCCWSHACMHGRCSCTLSGTQVQVLHSACLWSLPMHTALQQRVLVQRPHLCMHACMHAWCIKLLIGKAFIPEPAALPFCGYRTCQRQRLPWRMHSASHAPLPVEAAEGLTREVAISHVHMCRHSHAFATCGMRAACTGEAAIRAACPCWALAGKQRPKYNTCGDVWVQISPQQQQPANLAIRVCAPSHACMALHMLLTRWVCIQQRPGSWHHLAQRWRMHMVNRLAWCVSHGQALPGTACCSTGTAGG